MGAPIFDKYNSADGDEGGAYYIVPLKRFFFWNGIWNEVFQDVGFRVARTGARQRVLFLLVCVSDLIAVFSETKISPQVTIDMKEIRQGAESGVGK